MACVCACWYTGERVQPRERDTRRSSERSQEHSGLRAAGHRQGSSRATAARLHWTHVHHVTAAPRSAVHRSTPSNSPDSILLQSQTLSDFTCMLTALLLLLSQI